MRLADRLKLWLWDLTWGLWGDPTPPPTEEDPQSADVDLDLAMLADADDLNRLLEACLAEDARREACRGRYAFDDEDGGPDVDAVDMGLSPAEVEGLATLDAAGCDVVRTYGDDADRDRVAPTDVWTYVLGRPDDDDRYASHAVDVGSWRVGAPHDGVAVVGRGVRG